MSLQLNRSSKEPMSEINVTPFVDVMLVLLIIFMVTAPLLTVGVQVDLTDSAADSLSEDQEPLTLSINSKGEVFIQDHLVEFDKIVPKMGTAGSAHMENVFLKIAWPLNSSSPTYNQATLGLSLSKSDLNNAEPIQAKSVKFFSLQSIFAPKSRTTFISF